MKDRWNIKHDISEMTFLEWAVLIIIIIVLGIMIIAVIGAFVNEGNRITEGIVVDREYSSGGSYYHSNENGGYYTHTELSYRFCIEGEKNGERVQYWFEVTQGEYEKYQIGDNYP